VKTDSAIIPQEKATALLSSGLPVIEVSFPIYPLVALFPHAD